MFLSWFISGWQNSAMPLLLLWAVGRDVGGRGGWGLEVVLATVCSRWDQSEALDHRSLSQDGDVLIGGLFPFHNQPPAPDLRFTTPLDLQPCASFQGQQMRWAHAMVFAVDEINRDPFLLPGLRLGYRILDSCIMHPWCLRGALSLVAGRSPQYGRSADSVSLVIGDASSTQSMILASTLGPLSVPVISYQASCPCLSDRSRYPNFFRTIPSDVFQARTMARLAQRFSWSWVGAVAVDNDYGRLGIQVFQEEVQGTGVCLAFFETFTRATLARDMERAAGTIQASSARVILVFAWYTDARALLLELAKRNVTDRQFLASEAWSTSTELLQNPALFKVARGVLGVAIGSAPMPGFSAHLRGLHPSQHPEDWLLRELWEMEFGGAETLWGVESSFTDTSQLRTSYSVYLAVYAAAHALHSLLSCPNRNTPSWGNNPACSPPHNLSPAELLQHLKRVNFTPPLGDEFYFRGADIPAAYDLVNWWPTNKGSLKLATIGEVKGSDLRIDESAIQWITGSNEPPKSVCSESCPPGTRLANRKGQPVCCFDCIPCSDGEVSNHTGSFQCERCPEELWSNSEQTACILRQLEFLSFNETMGITLTTAALSGAAVTVGVFVVFLYHRHTPLVRANNSELSFLLLLSLKLCFLCSLVFIGQPSVWACGLQQAAFGISFVLCLSCLLVKTIVVLAAFRSSQPGTGALMRRFGPSQQRGSVCIVTCVQVVICAVWLFLSPPLPERDLGLQGSKVVLKCAAVGSMEGFSLVLGYIGLLASLCLLLAFLARKLPDNFNEAKLITFSMLIFCAVWVAFIPAYVSSPGKFTVAVEIFAILASSYGLLVCIFAPKCYIILLRPERNTKKQMMAKYQT
ncbi:extracellular calcium-sensing receptor-like [Hypomesus transpacificus]|uniref:extracellular calcium-sensing receptor-like n=1 Tax=Hypomesus transpacificus TaxID=137520 RepID=UPI001F0751E4|nr:extracellular calcium-sensing receptor-like [Hypomesus transpacificus]